MTVQLNQQFLHDVGITGLNEEEEQQTLESLGRTLEMRVGMALASQLSDDELKKAPKDIDESWLDEHIPNYKDIAKTEMDAMKDELTRSVAANKELVEKK